MCTGYWETCKCKDCKEVSSLYNNLEWLEQDRDLNKNEIKELEREIEKRGYSI